MRINELVKKKREEKGFSMDDMMPLLGWKEPNWNSQSFYDFETYQGEIVQLMDFETVKKLFQALDITWDEALKLMLMKGARSDEELNDSRDVGQLINTQIEKLGLSEDEIADKIGYNPVKTIGIKNANVLYFNDWTLESLFDLAKVLQIKPKTFIKKLV